MKKIGIVGGLAWPSSIVYYRVADLVGRGAEVIILGCTEFGLLVEPLDSAVPVIDTTLAHAEAAVDLALASRP
ncbi:aspartate/glutamate racemase family protein [Amycolatopsis sp. NPDC005232]|uniref:aspartate/glutamate racemase family protein n=1 Tax=Amycolatopsis sp. NPDC005232 TaxID=3157027 RepID=UPI0033B5EF94